jgi:hypothetical protein
MFFKVFLKTKRKECFQTQSMNPMLLYTNTLEYIPKIIKVNIQQRYLHIFIMALFPIARYGINLDVLQQMNG